MVKPKGPFRSMVVPDVTNAAGGRRVDSGWEIPVNAERTMLKLAIMFFIVIAPTLAGILFTAGLVMGNANQPTDNNPLLVGLAILGFVIAAPISYIVAKKVDAAIRPKKA